MYTKLGILSGNLAEFILTVVVTEDLEPPVINLVGEAEVILEVGGVYEDEGATALDSKDGNLTPFIDDGGTLDAVDTSQVGEYIIRYNVADMSGNRAVEVVRKVIVSDPGPEDAFSQFLEGLPEADRAPDADPDGDGLANLLEYAFGGDPSKSGSLELPTAKREGESLEILLVRLKPAQDADITIKIESIDKLGDLWEEVTTPVKGAIDGISQDNLPDDKPFANSHYERIKLVVPLDRFPVTVVEFDPADSIALNVYDCGALSFEYGTCAWCVGRVAIVALLADFTMNILKHILMLAFTLLSAIGVDVSSSEPPVWWKNALDFTGNQEIEPNLNGQLEGEVAFLQNTLVGPKRGDKKRPHLVAYRAAYMLFYPSKTSVGGYEVVLRDRVGEETHIEPFITLGWCSQ